MAASDDPPKRLNGQSLPPLVRAEIKRTELEFRQRKLDSRQALAKIIDALAGSMAGAVPYEDFEAALEEQIPAEAFRIAVQAGIIQGDDLDPEQLRSSSLTAASLETFRQRYERPFEIITLCDVAGHPEKAEDFIAREVPMAEARTELLDLRARLSEEVQIHSHVMPDTGTNWESAPVIDVTPRVVEPAPDLGAGAAVVTSLPPLDRLREIHIRLGRPWEVVEARSWLLAEKLRLGELIHDKALEWSERELRRLGDEEAAKRSQAAEGAAPAETVPRRKPGPKPDLDTAQLIADAVRERPDWKAELFEFCEELDKRGAPAPQQRGGGRYRNWFHALGSGEGGDRDRVIKAIEYHLKKLGRV
jgi:hypothetical protein